VQALVSNPSTEKNKYLYKEGWRKLPPPRKEQQSLLQTHHPPGIDDLLILTRLLSSSDDRDNFSRAPLKTKTKIMVHRNMAVTETNQ
jgi:hypothetical protein